MKEVLCRLSKIQLCEVFVQKKDLTIFLYDLQGELGFFFFFFNADFKDITNLFGHLFIALVTKFSEACLVPSIGH